MWNFYAQRCYITDITGCNLINHHLDQCKCNDYTEGYLENSFQLEKNSIDW